ncbi:MarC family protein [Humitalea sp. 24SJ18S-53]|uniref:MarC family protein n=1 Tax=Humitalea sp. 24SJ18S-53 TaxID=3422307 RepID=UPI003D66D157
MDGFIIARMISDYLFAFSTLISIINPFAIGFVFLERTQGLSYRERAALARRIAFYSLCVLLVAGFLGQQILSFFGISLAALRIAGGLTVALAGWGMLNAPDAPDATSVAKVSMAAANRMAFFPMTMPLTTGPGTIAASIALAANRSGDMRSLVPSMLVGLLVAATVSVVIYLAYRHAVSVARMLGPDGSRLVTRVSAFLLLCVGVQITLTGVLDALTPLVMAGR